MKADASWTWHALFLKWETIVKHFSDDRITISWMVKECNNLVNDQGSIKVSSIYQKGTLNISELFSKTKIVHYCQVVYNITLTLLSELA